MKAFISYVDDSDTNTEFATWLHSALKRSGSPVEPWGSFIDLPPVGTFERRLPEAVNICRLMLFVRGRYTPDSDICMDELRYARHYGKPIIILRIEPNLDFNPIIDDYPQVDFTQKRDTGLQILFERIRALEKPEGRLAQLQEELRRQRNRLRRLDPTERLIAERTVTALEVRVKELLAAAIQSSTENVLAHPAGRSATRHVPRMTSAVEASALLEELRRADASVILMIGPEGIGKTRLVRQLDQGGIADLHTGDYRTIYRQAYGPRSFTADDLTRILDDVAGQPDGPADTWHRRLDVTTLRRLETLVESLDDQQLIVIVDSGEALLDEASGQLADPELDDALEVLSSMQSRPLVKVSDLRKSGCSVCLMSIML